MKKAILPLIVVLLVVCGIGGYAFRAMSSAKVAAMTTAASANQKTVSRGPFGPGY